MKLREIELTCLGLEPKALDSDTSRPSVTSFTSQILCPDRPSSPAPFLREGALALGSDSVPLRPLEFSVFLLLSSRTQPKGTFSPSTSCWSTRGSNSYCAKGEKRKISDSNFGNHLGRRCFWCFRVFFSLCTYLTDMYKELAQLQELGSQWWMGQAKSLLPWSSHASEWWIQCFTPCWGL